MSKDILAIKGVAEIEGSDPIAYREREIKVTSYYGGDEKGPMFQISIDDKYVGLTRSQALELVNTIKNFI